MLSAALNDMIVRAIDVGYGNVKYVFQHAEIVAPVECGMFPSKSPVAGEKGLSAGLVKNRDTVVIGINGTDYEVGKGVELAQGTFDESSVLEKDFCLSDAYLARLRGALYYLMGSDEKTGTKYFTGNRIKLLMAGLPVAAYRSEDLRKKLTSVLVGNHELPDGRSVFVEQAIIMPQPMGAFFEYAYEKGLFDKMRNQTNLIIDPGFFTFDWLLSRGLTPNDGRSDSVNRGMSAVIKAIIVEAKKVEGWDAEIGMLTRMLEEHFREGYPFIVYNKEYKVSKYLAAAKGVINEAIAALTHSVGDGADIQNIILAGGGAEIYKEALQLKFPRHEIIVMNNPVFSNVRGFQLAGEQQLLSNIHNARKSSRAA